MKDPTNPQLIPESRKDPVYPQQWRKLHLGAKVILQGVVKKTGSVGDVTPLKTYFWVEEDCNKKSEGSKKKGRGNQEMLVEPGASEEKTPGKQAAPPKAVHDFEAAAIKALKQWRYRPGTMNDLPVDVYYTMIVEFTSCPKQPAKESP